MYYREYLDEFYKRLKEYLRTAALKAGKTPENGKAEKGPIPSTVALPSRVFVGREGVPEKLHRLLFAGRIPVVTGPGGTGKSELAFHYAAAFREDYPGGLFQIDMETAKGWDDALPRLLASPGLDMRAILGLDGKSGTGGDGTRKLSAEDIAGGLRWRAERAGRILLVLDNIVSAKAFLREPVLSGLSLPPEVAAVATARTLDILFRPTDRAVEFPLPDLAPEAALELLLKDNPAESDTERAAAKTIARLLDFRVLHLRAVPALLDDPYSLHAGSYVSLEVALRENLQKTVEDAMADYGEGHRTPTSLWTLTREALERYPMGKTWITLAHIAALLSPEGFRESSLRQFWDELVASKEASERSFLQALDVLRRHGILDKTEEGFRMHRLTAAVVRSAPGTAFVSMESLVKPVADYAGQLQKQRDFIESRRLYETALELYRQLAVANPETYRPDVAQMLNNLAIVHMDTQRFEEAEAEFKEALEIRRRLAEGSPDVYESDVAQTLNNLANLHKTTQRLSEAGAEYLEALEIRRRLAEECPDTYAPDVARTLNNLALLHSTTLRWDAAEKEYFEALTDWRSLATGNPGTYDSAVAATLNNLAILHKSTQRLAEAESEYLDALEIYRRLAAGSPEVYESDLAMTLNNLANLHCDAKRLPEAEAEYKDALKTYRRLAAGNLEVYEPNVATTLNNLANLHRDTQRLSEAETEYREALEIRRRLAAANPEAYELDVAGVLNDLALLHQQTERLPAAKAECEEAQKIRQRWSADNQEACGPDIAMTLNNLALLHRDTQRLVEAESEYGEALEIYRRLAAEAPEAYEPDVAATLCNMATFHKENGCVEEALREARGALESFARCAERAPGCFEDSLEKARALVTQLEKLAGAKTIRVYIGASTELEDVSWGVADLLELANRHFRPRGVEFCLTLPGEGPAAGDLVIALYGRDFGELPEKEFEETYRTFQKARKQKIFVCFKEPSDNATPAMEAFRNSFGEKYGHFYCHFETVDAVKFQLATQLLSLLPVKVAKDTLTVENGVVRFGKKPVAKMENLKFARQEPKRKSILRQIAVAEAEVAGLEADAKASPEDADLQEAVQKAKEKHQNLKEELNKFDGSLVETAIVFARRNVEMSKTFN